MEQIRLGGDATVYAYVHVGVGDRHRALVDARFDLFSYAVVDSYARHFTRAGFGDAVDAIRASHAAGDRGGALGAVSDEMIDAIEIVGEAALVRDAVGRYRAAGVDVPVVFPLTWGAPDRGALEETLRAATGSP